MNNASDISKLSDAEKSDLLKFLPHLQLKEKLQLISSISDYCFNKCVSSFKSRTLDLNEDKCLRNCLRRELKSYERCAIRVAEHQQQQNETVERIKAYESFLQEMHRKSSTGSQ